MKIELNFDLPRPQFKRHINRSIQVAKERKDVIPMPLECSQSVMIALLAQVNCEGCPAYCCKPCSGGKSELRRLDVLSLGYDEYARLAQHWERREQEVTRRDGFVEVPLPCPLLMDNRCIIYETRPLVCNLYPLDFCSTNGRPTIGLQSHCPEARKIAERVFMVLYDIRKSLSQLGAETIEAAMKM